MEAPNEDTIQRKEREWREALNAKFEQTNDSLRDRDVTIRQQRDKLELLQRDFQYNLGLLLDRDAELLRYEGAIKDLTSAVNEKTTTINDLRMKLDDTQLLTRRQFMDAEDIRRGYEKRLSEKAAAILDCKRQLDLALKKLETDAETHRRQLMKRDSDLQSLSHELQTEHTSAICRRDAQHAAEVADINARWQRETERSKSLECELQASQCQAIKLHTELTDLQMRNRDMEAAYKCQLEDFRLAIQGREDVINRVTSQLGEADRKLAERDDEMRQVRAERDRDRNGREEEINKTRNELREAQDKIDDFEIMIKKLNEKIEVLEKEKNTEIQKRDNCETQNNKHVEIEQLKNQNQVLRQVIKEMKRKVTSNVASCGVVNVEEIPNVRNLEGDTSGSQRKPEAKEASNDCNKCQTIRHTQESHRLEVEEELKQLRVKVNQLSQEINSNENEDEMRVRQLENTISLLKTQMLHSLQDKLQNKVNGGGGGYTKQNVSLGDVRIMLLEQKLDRAAKNIGKAVASEKLALMQEMHRVRKELVTKFEEARHKSPVGSADRRAKLKSDELFEKVRNEIARLERKFDHCGDGNRNRCNDTSRGRNELTLPLQRGRLVPVVTRLEAPPQEEHRGILSASTNDSALARVLDSIPAEADTEGGLPSIRPTVRPVVIHPSRQTVIPRQVAVAPKLKPLRLKVRN